MNDDSRRRLRVSLAVVTLVLGVFAAVVLFQVTSQPGTEPVDASDADEVAETLVRDDSHRLDDAGPDAPTLVEFLDLECESCAATYPVVEDLREAYDGELNVVLRYFPLEGHANARNAAHAVEAAARQGALEEMYSRMFETQAEWGEQQEDQSPLFRSWAEELGLDLDRYDRDVASDDVAERVERDYQDGLRLGVTGTPTFFLEDKLLDVTTVEQMTASIDDAIRRRAEG